jgi:Na+/H+ antiporter NhaD/arsenite permease-like protein
MSAAAIILASILVATIVAQALLPKLRVTLLVTGAVVSLAACARLGVASPRVVLSAVPWDVLVILVALGALSELLAESRVFDVLAVRAARASGGAPTRVLIVFSAGMYLVSGLVNNLTALLLVLPVELVLLRLLGADQRFVRWALGTLLVCCNLGGAATPIGDFPAILLLSRGRMGFGAYLARALPVTAIAAAVTIAIVAWAVKPARALPSDPLTRSLTVATVQHLYRRVSVDRSAFVPAALCLFAMLVAWFAAPPSSGLTPEVIAWIGACVALLAVAARGEAIVRKSIQAEAVLSLLALFVMVGAVRESGAFTAIARALQHATIAPSLKLALFLLLTSVLTAVFSAGPSMAALLDVAESLATTLPPATVYVGLALAVCAGSSLLLTAATAGPLAQAIVEAAGLRDSKRAPLLFNFREHLAPGLLGYAVTLGAAFAFVYVSLAFAG